jgi:protein SCO1/2
LTARFAVVLLAFVCAHAHAAFDRTQALAASQAAIGRTLTEHLFYTTDGTVRRLSEYAGKPLVISLIFTSCHHICPTTTQHLAKVVRKARNALGDDSFSVVTIGFDTAHDTADAMRAFAREQNVAIKGWEFLATDAATIDALSRELGFQFQPTAGGFDHLIQSSIVDAKGVVFRQVYGIEFDTPHLIEPLKVLVFGPDATQSLVEQVTARVRLFCTVYDPASDAYRFNYSIFVGLVVGIVMGAFFVVLLIREWRHRKLQLRQTVPGET